MLTLFPSQDLKNKRVFIRADLNVENVHDTHRLKALLPTLDLLHKRGAKIILATHIGRPKNHESELSTKKLLSWLTAQGYPTAFEPDLDAAYQKSFADNNTILLLENLRFFAGEQASDPTQRTQFAKKLALLADFYVNDAFADLHRNDTSITDLPLLFTAEKRSLGLLTIKELTQLHHLFTNPPQPFLAFFGGNKLDTKIALLAHLIPKLSTIALCPALVFSFLHYQQKPVGQSLVDKNSFEDIQRIFELIKKHHVSLLLPVDYLVANDQKSTHFYVVDAQNFPSQARGISIGPKTADLYVKKINESRTILYNGLSGFADEPKTLQETYTLFKAMNNAHAQTIIAGGDSVASAQQAGYTSNISYLSTGGGSTLAFLSEQPLPGLKAFKEQIKEAIQ